MVRKDEKLELGVEGLGVLLGPKETADEEKTFELDNGLLNLLLVDDGGIVEKDEGMLCGGSSSSCGEGSSPLNALIIRLPWPCNFLVSARQ